MTTSLSGLTSGLKAYLTLPGFRFGFRSAKSMEILGREKCSSHPALDPSSGPSKVMYPFEPTHTPL